MNRSLKPLVDVVQAQAPQTVTADVVETGVDLKGYDSAMMIVNIGAIAAAGLVIPVARESDDNVTFTDVAAGDLQGAFVNGVASSIQRVGYIGSKRYLGVKLHYISGTSVLMSATVARGKPAVGPV